VIDLLQAGISSARVTEIVNDRGVDFELNSAIEQRIRKAGGGDDLVSALRRASRHHNDSDQPQPRTGGLRIQSTPGEAQVYLNDEPKGMTSREGEIRLPDLPVGSYNLRVSLPGYQSWENKVTISPGEVQVLYVTLVAGTPQTPANRANPTSERPATQYTPPAAGIPVAGVKVTGVQFFEGPLAQAPPQGQRVYRYAFGKLTTRAVYWELDLNYPNPSQRIDFSVLAIWYNPQGAEMARQTLEAYVQPEWKSSTHCYGRGWARAGNWGLGIYRVDLYVQNTRVASGTFQIN